MESYNLHSDILDAVREEVKAEQGQEFLSAVEDFIEDFGSDTDRLDEAIAIDQRDRAHRVYDEVVSQFDGERNIVENWDSDVDDIYYAAMDTFDELAQNTLDEHGIDLSATA